MVDADLDAPYINTRVADIAQGRYYYDFVGDGENQSLEKLFGILETQLSQNFRNVLTNAEEGLPLTEIDKAAILNFLKLQFLRSDWMRDKIPQQFITENFRPDYIDKADKLLHAYIISQGLFTEILDYILEYAMKIYTSDNIELFTSSFPLFFHHTVDITDLIDRLISPKNSSKPSLDVNLFFPLSSKHVIYIYNPSNLISFNDQEWYSSFLTSGIAWSRQRIYFQGSQNGLSLYSALKPLLKLGSK